MIRLILIAALSAGLSAHAHSPHPQDSSAHFSRLERLLENLEQSTLSHDERRLLWASTAALIESGSDAEKSLHSELQQKRVRLHQKLLAELNSRSRALKNWLFTPVGEALRQSLRASLGFVEFLRETVTTLPVEIAARSYSGFFEFGSLYLFVVAPTYPIWFFASEAAEHAILGAPVGMACTQLQLGYFVVIGSFLAPTKIACDYARGGMKTGLAQALSDYFQYRLLKGHYKKLQRKSDLAQSQVWNSGDFWLKSMARHWALYSSLQQNPPAESALPLDPHFKTDIEWAALTRLALEDFSHLLKEAREQDQIGLADYFKALRLSAELSKTQRRLFVARRKSEPESTRWSQSWLGIFLKAVRMLKSDSLHAAQSNSLLKELQTDFSKKCAAALNSSSNIPTVL